MHRNCSAYRFASYLFFSETETKSLITYIRKDFILFDRSGLKSLTSRLQKRSFLFSRVSQKYWRNDWKRNCNSNAKWHVSTSLKRMTVPKEKITVVCRRMKVFFFFKVTEIHARSRRTDTTLQGQKECLTRHKWVRLQKNKSTDNLSVKITGDFKNTRP